MIEYTVPVGGGRERADKVLSRAFPEHSRSAFQRAFEAGLVRMGARVMDQAATVFEGDVLQVDFPAVVAASMRAVAIPLKVLFEDRHLIVVNKAAGMVVHPGAGTGEDTLVHALLAHCKGSLSGIGGVERPGIVHRLDRETSGVIVAAKSDAAHQGLASQFATRALHKEYLALVAGSPRLDSGVLSRPIARNPRKRHTMTTVEDGAGGRDARTDWQVVERFGSAATLVRCVIHTGRTHQIRVHMKSMGLEVMGDRTYGWRPSLSGGHEAGRVMLHAAKLQFTHPITGRPLTLEAPLPPDFEAVLRGLRQAPIERAAATSTQIRLKAGRRAALGQLTGAEERAAVWQDPSPRAQGPARTDVTRSPKKFKRRAAAKTSGAPAKPDSTAQPSDRMLEAALSRSAARHGPVRKSALQPAKAQVRTSPRTPGKTSTGASAVKKSGKRTAGLSARQRAFALAMAAALKRGAATARKSARR